MSYRRTIISCLLGFCCAVGTTAISYANCDPGTMDKILSFQQMDDAYGQNYFMAFGTDPAAACDALVHQIAVTIILQRLNQRCDAAEAVFYQGMERSARSLYQRNNCHSG